VDPRDGPGVRSAASSACACRRSAWGRCCARWGCRRSGPWTGPGSRTRRRCGAGMPRSTPRSASTLPRWAPRSGSPMRRGALRRPRGHHLGAGLADPGGSDHRDRVAVNLISAVTAKGALRFAAYHGTLTGPVFIDCCRRPLADTPRRCSALSMAIRCTARAPSRSSPPPPGSGCACFPAGLLARAQPW
jgi:hypothetical protein